MHVVCSTLKQPIDSKQLDAIQVWTEQGERQQRQISACITIPYTIEQVWQVLTNYEQMPDFIPNLIKTQRIPHPKNGIRIEQIGYCQILKVRFSARIVLDMMEQFPHRILFEMVEGDFQKFSGYCELETSGTRTILHYSVQVQPKLSLPIALLERQLRRDLPINLLAIRQQVEKQNFTSPVTDNLI